MEWIKVDPERPEPAVAKAAETLRAGGVIIFPAERLYGLAADATNQSAVIKVFALKDRKPDHPLPVIIGDEAEAEEWVIVSESARRLMKKFWPGPLTLVLPLQKDEQREAGASGSRTGREAPKIKRMIASAVLGGSDYLGLRVPGNRLGRAIAQRLGRPMTATSANLSGAKEARSAEEAASRLTREVDLVLDAGVLPGPPGSTVVKVREPDLEIIRVGIIDQDRIHLAWKEAFSR